MKRIVFSLLMALMLVCSGCFWAPAIIGVGAAGVIYNDHRNHKRRQKNAPSPVKKIEAPKEIPSTKATPAPELPKPVT